MEAKHLQNFLNNPRKMKRPLVIILWSLYRADEMIIRSFSFRVFRTKFPIVLMINNSPQLKKYTIFL